MKRCPRCGAEVLDTALARWRCLLIVRNLLLGTAVIMGIVVAVYEARYAGRNRATLIDLLRNHAGLDLPDRLAFLALGMIILIALFLLIAFARRRCGLCGTPEQ
jgi:hypothetical protein